MPKGKISDELIVKVAEKVTTIWDCNQLAGCLNVGLDDVECEKEKGTRSPTALALFVLRRWKRNNGQRATAKRLFDILDKNANLHFLTEALEPAEERTEESQTATTSLPQIKQPRPGGVNAVWTSSSGRFAVVLDEELSSQIPDSSVDLSTTLTDFFKGLLGNTGCVKFQEKTEDMLQLMSVSMGVKLESDFTAEQLEQSLTSPLASYIGLPPSRLQCHKVIQSKFGRVTCVYSLPMKKADSLLQKWSDAEKAQELQEVFSELPALITPSRPISSITGTINEALWGFSTNSTNPSQPLSTTWTNFRPKAEKRMYESTCGPQEIASSSTSLASESSTQPSKRRHFDHSAEQQQQEALDEGATSSCQKSADQNAGSAQITGYARPHQLSTHCSVQSSASMNDFKEHCNSMFGALKCCLAKELSKPEHHKRDNGPSLYQYLSLKLASPGEKKAVPADAANFIQYLCRKTPPFSPDNVTFVKDAFQFVGLEKAACLVKRYMEQVDRAKHCCSAKPGQYYVRVKMNCDHRAFTEADGRRKMSKLAEMTSTDVNKVCFLCFHKGCVCLCLSFPPKAARRLQRLALSLDRDKRLVEIGVISIQVNNEEPIFINEEDHFCLGKFQQSDTGKEIVSADDFELSASVSAPPLRRSNSCSQLFQLPNVNQLFQPQDVEPLNGKKRKEKQSSSHEETASEEDGTNLGKELRQGIKVLLKISLAVSSLEDVIAIATYLLEGIEPTGGRAWVESKKSHGGVLNPSRTAHDLFEYWCKKSPTVPYGGRLLQVLKEVVPEVGRKFESELL